MSLLKQAERLLMALNTMRLDTAVAMIDPVSRGCARQCEHSPGKSLPQVIQTQRPDIRPRDPRHHGRVGADTHL